MLIYGLNFGMTGIDEFIDVAKGYTYTCEAFGTGSELNIYLGNEVIGTYQLVIFGDLNGDCWADGADAVISDCIVNGLITQEKAGKAVYMAADCNHDLNVGPEDTALLSKAGIMKTEIDQFVGDITTSSVYTEYVQLISQTESVAETEEITPKTENLFRMIINILMMILSFFTT